VRQALVHRLPRRLIIFSLIQQRCTTFYVWCYAAAFAKGGHERGELTLYREFLSETVDCRKTADLRAFPFDSHTQVGSSPVQDCNLETLPL
jgi:hypothetical protein